MTYISAIKLFPLNFLNTQVKNSPSLDFILATHVPYVPTFLGKMVSISLNTPLTQVERRKTLKQKSKMVTHSSKVQGK
jgi:hypothetical protein